MKYLEKNAKQNTELKGKKGSVCKRADRSKT